MVKMAQYGVGHGHAAGKMQAMHESPEVEVVGIYEPSPEKRARAEGMGAYIGLRWFDTEAEMLNDAGILAVASEGNNIESLSQTEAIVAAGKHVWYDKPAGDVWEQWQRVVAAARQQKLHIQMGYMLRYNPSFRQVSDWARSGFLGQVFAVRAHMSMRLSAEAMEAISAHRGGIHYDLGAHMLDQIVWILGRPNRVTTFLRSDGGMVPGFADNTLAVYEFDRAMAFIDIAALEPQPMARRFEVYGTRGSAIIPEPFEPGGRVRLCLDEAREGYIQGEQLVEVEPMGRRQTYDRELVHFLDVISGEAEPDRGLDHELLVQESLLRGAGQLSPAEGVSR